MPKRKLSAETVEGEPLREEPERARSGMGGTWGGTALNMVRRRLEESREALLDGVLSGTVIVEVDPEDIEDAIGSDREMSWQGDAEIGDLIENIRQRDQTQPVRLRPTWDDWKPNSERPTSPRVVPHRVV